ncbi:hypothetical protein DDE18_01320 [Nocardioides gansuensis]|uniref:Uncharacterized protein n=1 Tax=Nocardioides gansuensis TaxID=2138300 RepID=A0A2T8FF34_9ACTN|nr:hypothetical protein [Nocardioides gansuensis]PVG84300.1 hypothetical protein DDE18_01320 [Nocardioides gansuensis]
MIAVLTQAVRPTARTIAWRPVAGVAAGLVLLSVLLVEEDRAQMVMAWLGAAVTASLLVAAIRDRASRLLAAVPTPLSARRLLRLAIVAPVPVAVLVLVVGLRQPDGPLPLLGDVTALTLAGLGVASWMADERGVAWGAGLPLAWVAGAQFGNSSAGAVGDALLWWHTDSLVVGAIAAGCVLLGARR